MIKLYMIQIKLSKINVIKRSVIMVINWTSIFIFSHHTHLSYLDHSTFFCRTILFPLRSLKYINQDQIIQNNQNQCHQNKNNQDKFWNKWNQSTQDQALHDSDQSDQNQCEHNNSLHFVINQTIRNNLTLITPIASTRPDWLISDDWNVSVHRSNQTNFKK